MKRRFVRDKCRMSGKPLSIEDCIKCRWSGRIWVYDKNKLYRQTVECKFDPELVAKKL